MRSLLHIYGPQHTRRLPAGQPGVYEKSPEIAEADTFYVYRRAPLSGADVTLQEGYRFRFWTPGQSGLLAPEMGSAGLLWSAFHLAGIFESREYKVVYIEHDGQIVHRSCILPACYRCPFMGKTDIQVSSTFTAPGFRNRGLARSALRKILLTAGPECGHVWYISRISNIHSIAVCKREGFRLWGVARRTAPFGVRAFGRFQAMSTSLEGDYVRSNDN